MDSLFRESKKSEKGREGVCHCGLTSSTAPEGLTDSRAKYNVLETPTTAAINLNYDHINPPLKTRTHACTSTHSAVLSSLIRLFLLELTARKQK